MSFGGQRDGDAAEAEVDHRGEGVDVADAETAALDEPDLGVDALQPGSWTVTIVASGMKSSKIVKDAQFKIYPGAPHGLTATMQDQFNADLLAFLKS